MKVNEKINQLREKMREHNIEAYIIPGNDPHNSEYVCDYFMARQWISGFTGSAGIVVVTLEKSVLWTDGRYHIQAEKELEGSEIELYKSGIEGVPTYIEWLKQNLSNQTVLGINGKLITITEYDRLKKALFEKGIRINIDDDLIEAIWNDRPAMPRKQIYRHGLEHAGKTTIEKLIEVRKVMTKESADYFIITSLTDIAWLFNLRGNDIQYNPLFLSYALIGRDKATLFINNDKYTKDIQLLLKSQSVGLKEYTDIYETLSRISGNNSIIIDENQVSIWLRTAIKNSVRIIKRRNITEELKAKKNKNEIRNLKKCHIRDGVAMVRFLNWMDKNINNEKITEYDLSQRIRAYRDEEEFFVNESFASISAFNENAAMMHYEPSNTNPVYVEGSGLYLLDSGGQYYDGTTDITRTIVIGEITEAQKKDFTLVLKAHIAIARAKFLKNTTGANIDILARRHLWKYGIDYKCGTGHGVGFFLSVHEGPQSISPRGSKAVLEESMILTNEPGIYREGKYGIRIENTLIVVKDKTTEFGEFLKFKTISYCPIDMNGIDTTLLDMDEISWINKYHKKTYKKLSPFLNEEEKEFLKKKTEKIILSSDDSKK